ncbi:DMT family transporter [Candidatus Bathyarchaeota archaeon]|nr:DMT family transporter [Candidatus Bathyarchaeota archaeon]
MRTKNATSALLITTVIWGASFVVVKVSVESIPPLTFIAARFIIAFAILMAASRRELKENWRTHLTPAILLGIFLFIGFAFQVWGLQRTSAANAGFITGLSVVLVGLLDVVVNKRLPTIYTLVGFISALVGLLFLSLNLNLTFAYGDLLVLICAIAFGLHVFFTDKYAKKMNTKVLTLEQITFVAFAATLGALFTERLNFTASTYAVFGIIYSGVLGTAGAYFLQTWGQRYANATYSAIVLSLEPVFAAIFAALLLAESVTIRLVVGGALIVLGMTFSSVKNFGAH